MAQIQGKCRLRRGKGDPEKGKELLQVRLGHEIRALSLQDTLTCSQRKMLEQGKKKEKKKGGGKKKIRAEWKKTGKR